jgi:hypothetical protein
VPGLPPTHLPGPCRSGPDGTAPGPARFAVVLTTLSQPAQVSAAVVEEFVDLLVGAVATNAENIKAVPVKSDVERGWIGAPDHRPPWLGSTDRELQSGRRLRRYVRLAARVSVRGR